SFMNWISASRGMRRNRLPGTRKPRRRPLSKQRMMVCWETLHISAASPVVKTVFIEAPSIQTHLAQGTADRALKLGEIREQDSFRFLLYLSHLTIGWGFWQLEGDRWGKADCHPAFVL